MVIKEVSVPNVAQHKVRFISIIGLIQCGGSVFCKIQWNPSIKCISLVTGKQFTLSSQEISFRILNML